MNVASIGVTASSCFCLVWVVKTGPSWEVRAPAVQRIIKARSDSQRGGRAKKIRIFEFPKPVYDAADFESMIDWQSESHLLLFFESTVSKIWKNSSKRLSELKFQAILNM